MRRRRSGRRRRRCGARARRARSADVVSAPRSSPWRDLLWRGSGARAGDLYRRLLALLFVVAWLSLGSQVRLLMGARGLLPVRDLIEAVRDPGGISFADIPTLVWWAPSS